MLRWLNLLDGLAHSGAGTILFRVAHALIAGRNDNPGEVVLVSTLAGNLDCFTQNKRSQQKQRQSKQKRRQVEHKPIDGR